MSWGLEPTMAAAGQRLAELLWVYSRGERVLSTCDDARGGPIDMRLPKILT